MKTGIIVILFLAAGVIGPECYGQQTAARAKEFLASLSPDLRTKTQFPITDAERFNWHFVPVERKGSTFRDYSENQRQTAWAFLKASVGEAGYNKARAITELENVLIEIEHRAADNHYRDPLNYHFLIFGEPSDEKAWGWRFEGHHISISLMLDKGVIVSSTPSFFGSNPGIVPSGTDKGKEVLKRETDLGFQLVNLLSADQLKLALFESQAPPEIISFDKVKVPEIKTTGVPYASLTAPQKKVFMELLGVYLANYELGFSATLEKKIDKAGKDNLFFAWAGSTTAGTPNYYRIQGPMLLIEYDNTQNNANHVHTVVRDLTNDFAEDILKEHYRAEHAAH